jgi:hypothetical protein
MAGEGLRGMWLYMHGASRISTKNKLIGLIASDNCQPV